METGELIAFYRKQAGLTIDELAEKSAVPKGTLNKIIGGVTKAPTLDNMKAIAKALGKTLSDFDDAPSQIKKTSPISEEAESIAKKYDILDKFGQKAVKSLVEIEYARCTSDSADEDSIVAVPLQLSEQTAAAGSGTYLGPEAFRIIYVRADTLAAQAAFAVPVSGDSMEPQFQDGDILLVDKAPAEVGEIGVFTLQGNGYVKQLGASELISLNPRYEPIPMDDSVICNGKVIGKLNPEWIVKQ